MWERPQAQLLLGNLAQARQPMRLNNQEENDQPAEQHELDMRHRRIGERQVQERRQRWQHVVEEDRQQQDEGRAEEGTKYAADTTNDDHEQDAKRQIQ